MEEAVFLPPPQMMGVMHGDRVRVSVERGRDGRYSGKLEKILEHATKAFVGTLEVHGRTAFVTSADRRIGMRCLVPPDELGGLGPQFPNRRVVIVGAPEEETLWDSPLALILFLSLMTAEWVGRRLIRFV